MQVDAYSMIIALRFPQLILNGRKPIIEVMYDDSIETARTPSRILEFSLCCANILGSRGERFSPNGECWTLSTERAAAQRVSGFFR